ncbi:Gfo/Idh/MocA family oxidoreductase [Pseudonocardia halophobica]|uniref:Gfo/Idh/MocA family oxidoreductase n=1 Tax=Pseudonocardia halophobica TaxID=29401 RepID=UPI003D8C957C
MTPLKIAVVGAGVMGTNHARVARSLPGVQVTHVVDPDPERAARAAAVAGAEPLADVGEIVGEVDAAIVASPSSMHEEHGLALLAAGVHVLVEKPVATTVEQAERLIAAADAAGMVLQVGHVERFNPAVLELDRMQGDVVHVEASRIGPYSNRVEVGVVLDLMIHDLDIVLALAGGEPSRVLATAQRTRSGTEDLVSALIEFDNGVTAALTASRIGQNKIRNLALTREKDYVNVDLLRQDVTVHRVDHSEYLSDEGTRYRQTGVVELPFLEHRGEPLFLELSHFVDCVRTGTTPRVTGRDGARALELAMRVRAAAGL